MSVVLGIDIGGASRNGFSVVDENETLLYSDSILFNKKNGKGLHRRSIAKHAEDLVKSYNCSLILLESVRLFRHSSISPLNNILSLSHVTSTIIDACYTLCEIFEVQTVTWKASILGHKTATKDDAIFYVSNKFGISVPHDEADAICISLYGMRNIQGLLNDRIGKRITND